MSYAVAFGADESVAPSAADKTPHYSRQALAIMGVTLIPWTPVIAGYYLGDRFGAPDSGRLVGGALGFLVSFLAVRYVEKQMSGTIT